MKKLLLLLLFLQISCTQTTDKNRDCSSNPCENGGICTDTADGYQCDCKETGFVGKNCETVPRPFITTWKTDNEGVSKPNQIIIPTKGDGYDYTIDCDSDGIAEAYHQTGDYTCEYEKPGTYTVSITGDFPRIYFDDYWFIEGENDNNYDNNYDNEKILSVEQWGTIEWSSMKQAFANCMNLAVNATDIPYLSNVTDMNGMFEKTVKFNQDISSWDVSLVSPPRDVAPFDPVEEQSMRLMFSGVTLSTENYDALLNGWSQLDVQDGVEFNGGGNHYCSGEAARQSIIDDYGWKISDGGKDSSCEK